jgi:hypothetical protein
VTVEGTSSQKKQATVVQVREGSVGTGDVCALTMPLTWFSRDWRCMRPDNATDVAQ